MAKYDPVKQKDWQIAEIAEAEMIPFDAMCDKLGIPKEERIPAGQKIGRVDYMKCLERLKSKPDGKYIEVTAITPTPLGEGKSTTSMGLIEGLGKRGMNVGGCIRQPSGGPTMNIKGTAAGGGISLLIPMTEFSLGLTGDINNIMNAHNLAMVAATSRLQHEFNYDDEQLAKRNLKRLNINPKNFEMGWIMDYCAQALRNITIGRGSKMDGFLMDSKFGIAVSSEVMAILSVFTSLADLKERLNKWWWLRQEGQPHHHRRPGSGQRHDRLDAALHQPHPDADRGEAALLRARRPLRQHRGGPVLHRRRPDRPEAL